MLRCPSMTSERTDAEHGGRGQAEQHRRHQIDRRLVDRQLLLGVDGPRMVAHPTSRRSRSRPAVALRVSMDCSPTAEVEKSLPCSVCKRQRHVGQRRDEAAEEQRC